MGYRVTEKQKMNMAVAFANGAPKKEIGEKNKIPASVVARVLRSEDVQEYIRLAQSAMIESIPQATEALTGLIKDYSDKKTRKKMEREEKSRAWQTCVKAAESVGIFSGTPSMNVVTIVNNTNVNVSNNVLNIISETINKKLSEVKDYEEIKYEEETL